MRKRIYIIIELIYIRLYHQMILLYTHILIQSYTVFISNSIFRINDENWNEKKETFLFGIDMISFIICCVFMDGEKKLDVRQMPVKPAADRKKKNKIISNNGKTFSLFRYLFYPVISSIILFSVIVPDETSASYPIKLLEIFVFCDPIFSVFITFFKGNVFVWTETLY